MATARTMTRRSVANPTQALRMSQSLHDPVREGGERWRDASPFSRAWLHRDLFEKETGRFFPESAVQAPRLNGAVRVPARPLHRGHPFTFNSSTGTVTWCCTLCAVTPKNRSPRK